MCHVPYVTWIHALSGTFHTTCHVSFSHGIVDASVPLRRSQRTRRLAIPDDYELYLQEHDFDISDGLNLVTYEDAISSSHPNFLLDAIEDEMKSMTSNGV